MCKTLKEELERNTEFQICKEKNTGHRVIYGPRANKQFDIAL